MGMFVEEKWLFRHFAELGEGTKLWRYLSIDKFYDLLARKALFYARPDKLGEKFEGSLPYADAQIARNRDADIHQIRVAGGFANPGDPYWERSASSRQDGQKLRGISCWHMNEFESYAMWNLYLQMIQVAPDKIAREHGVAIQTTVGRLFRALAQHPSTFLRPSPFAGKVEYINFRGQDKWRDTFSPEYQLLCKGVEFCYEQELRIIQQIHDGTSQFPLNTFWEKQEFQAGLHFSIDIDFIESAVFSPAMPLDIQEQIKGEASRHIPRLSFSISRLDDEPIWA